MDKKYAQYLLNKTIKDYNSIAGDFSRSREKIWGELRSLEKYVSPKDRVLDLGCGNGRLYDLIEKKNVSYCGLDASEKLVEIAREKYPEADFKVGDALDLPFAENSFDKIISIGVFHHISSFDMRLKFLKEACRVLRPEGFLIVTVWKLPPLKEMILRAKFLFLKFLGKSKMGSGDVLVPWNRDCLRYVHLFDEKELRKLAEKAGLKVKETGLLKSPGKKHGNLYFVAEK